MPRANAGPPAPPMSPAGSGFLSPRLQLRTRRSRGLCLATMSHPAPPPAQLAATCLPTARPRSTGLGAAAIAPASCDTSPQPAGGGAGGSWHRDHLHTGGSAGLRRRLCLGRTGQCFALCTFRFPCGGRHAGAQRPLPCSHRACWMSPLTVTTLLQAAYRQEFICHVSCILPAACEAGAISTSCDRREHRGSESRAASPT